MPFNIVRRYGTQLELCELPGSAIVTLQKLYIFNGEK